MSNAETLLLQVSSAAAQADLKALSRALDAAGASASRIDRTFATAMAGLDASLTRASVGMSKFADAAKLIGSANFGNAGQGIMAITAGLRKLPTGAQIAPLEKLFALLRNVPHSAGLSSLAALSGFKGPSAASVRNTEALIKVFANAKIGNAGALAREMETVAVAARKLNDTVIRFQPRRG